jgi:hypothetical protein
MPTSAAVQAMLDRGYMRHGEIAVFLGVTRDRAVQLSAMDGFPPVQEIAGRPTWRTETIEPWAEADWWGTKRWRVRPA